MLQNNVQHKLNNVVQSVTKRIMERSTTSRAAYLTRMKNLSHHIIERSQLSCTNLAHQMASSDNKTKIQLKQISNNSPKNIGIISAYNDVLSAHAPYYNYPELIKAELKKYNVVAQVAAGVPAMCDGITQGQVGMELSLFSRDVIALSTAVALSHNVFDAGIYLGICDKIVPGLLIGALSFGFLPAIFIPSGPMASGLSNVDKTTIRKKYASGMITKEELLEYEMKAYHSSGTCTFYGTANSNQMLMEIMGLQLPGSSFINPNTTLRNLLTNHAIKQIANIVSNINNINEISNPSN